MRQDDRNRILSAAELGLRSPPRDEALWLPLDPLPSPGWNASEDLWLEFQQELEKLSARFHRAESLEEAQAGIRSVLAEHSVKKAVRWEHPLLHRLGLDELLAEAGVEVRSSREGAERIGRHVEAELGITVVDAVLAESGTLVMKAMPGHERATSILPPVHLAIATMDQLLPSTLDLVPLLKRWLAVEGRLPSAIHLVSGPSRTADIELTLVLGAHGPKVVHVLVLDYSAKL
jgi:L-lactate dehydrogenase complex protein LldG